MAYSCHQWHIPGRTGSISVCLRIATTRRMQAQTDLRAPLATDSLPPLQTQRAMQEPARVCGDREGRER
jgi:hypothetical protein